MARKTNVISPSVRSASRPRVQDWPTLLFHFIESRRHQPFQWGKQDCCLFACDGILAQTGLDPAAEMFRGKYRDALGAARLVRKHGGIEAIAVKVCRKYGWPELFSPRLAQRGDVVLMDVTDGMKYMLGVSIGDSAAFPGTDGLVFLPLKACRRAWAIGRGVRPEHGGAR